MGLELHVQVFRDNQMVGQHAFDSDANRTIKIGRLNSAQLKLDDPAASRIHAVIELAGNGASLIDMGSSTGTLVNGSKIHKTKLNHGDQITVGDTILVVGVGSPVAAASEATATAPAAAPGVAPGQPMQAPSPGAAPGMAPAQQMPAASPAGVSRAPMIGGQQSTVPGAAPAQMPSAAAVPPGAGPAQQSAVPGMPAQQAVAPVQQPRFEGGADRPARRATRDRVFSAAVESRPHPSLPPEPAITNDNRVLEMRVYWGEALLRVSHFHQPKRITLGEAKGTDFFISSEGLPVEIFPFVRFMGNEYVLTFTKQMDGEIEIDGNLHKFETLRGSSLARKDPDLEDSYQINLGMNARALVHWGGATFALRFVPPAKGVPSNIFQGVDLQFVNLLVLSVFFHLATVLTMMWYPYDTDALRVDLFDEDAGRFADIVLHGPTENDSTEDLLERLKKQIEEKKEEVKKPDKKPELIVKQVPKKREKSKAEKKAEVKQKFSKLFSSGSGKAGGSLLGGGGGGTLAGTLSNVIGTAGKGSATAGLAGLGIRGTGPMTGGGIGTSRGIAGIGTSGRAGGGGLAYGSGIGIGKKRKRNMISLSTPVVMGALPREAIQKVINQNKAQIRYCYEVELQRNQKLEGRIMVQWIIAATGSVAKVRIRDSTMKSTAVERCIASKIKTWKFPAPSGGGIVEVNYPFVFRAG